MQEVLGSIPAGSEEKLVSEHAFLRVICRDDMNKVRCPSDCYVNWKAHVQGQSSHVQVKDHYTGSIKEKKTNKSVFLPTPAIKRIQEDVQFPNSIPQPIQKALTDEKFPIQWDPGPVFKMSEKSLIILSYHAFSS